MNFRFLTIGSNGSVDNLGDFDLDEQVVEPEKEIERRFRELADLFDVGQVVVLCRSIGSPPGLVVAIERVSTLRGAPDRRLTWLMVD